jgi:hypothetical protein
MVIAPTADLGRQAVFGVWGRLSAVTAPETQPRYEETLFGSSPAATPGPGNRRA